MDHDRTPGVILLAAVRGAPIYRLPLVLLGDGHTVPLRWAGSKSLADAMTRIRYPASLSGAKTTKPLAGAVGFRERPDEKRVRPLVADRMGNRTQRWPIGWRLSLVDYSQGPLSITKRTPVIGKPCLLTFNWSDQYTPKPASSVLCWGGRGHELPARCPGLGGLVRLLAASPSQFAINEVAKPPERLRWASVGLSA